MTASVSWEVESLLSSTFSLVGDYTRAHYVFHLNNPQNIACPVAVVDCTYVVSVIASFKDLITLHRRILPRKQQIYEWVTRGCTGSSLPCWRHPYISEKQGITWLHAVLRKQKKGVLHSPWENVNFTNIVLISWVTLLLTIEFLWTPGRQQPYKRSWNITTPTRTPEHKEKFYLAHTHSRTPLEDPPNLYNYPERKRERWRNVWNQLSLLFPLMVIAWTVDRDKLRILHVPSLSSSASLVGPEKLQSNVR